LIWAIGDTTTDPNGEGLDCPPTAQAAVRQGQHNTKNLLQIFDKKDPIPFRFRKLWHVATLGHHNGMCDIQALGFGVSSPGD